MKASSVKRGLCLARNFGVPKLVLWLLVCGAALVTPGHNSAQHTDNFPAFWGKFKSAVISRDKKTVAALSRFPIGMSNGASNIANNRELARRFSEVFDQDTNAAQCFLNTAPTVDTERPERYTVVCPNKGDSFVAYEFERVHDDWKFVHRQFPTNCTCR
jgi:hypothetical protein